jgi:actin-like ATPase involved in cell morphogenesis
MAYYLGIDLGTTYTAAASERAGVVEALTLGNRSASVPTVVFLRDDGEILVGEAATRRATSDPGRVAREFKRRVGDPTPIILGGTPYAAEMLMARVLRWSVDRVCEQQGEEPRAIALTHPANWGHYKLDLLTQAVRQVDLDAALLLAEPVAAATFYASQRRLEPGSVVAVYDLGGGTFDAAAVRRTGDGFEIIGSPEGIERLGGIDFDEAVFAHVRLAVGDALDRLDPEEPAAQAAVARLRQECIDAKEALSSDTDVSIPVLLPGLQTEVRLTRVEFEAMIRPAISETIVALRRAIRSAGVDAGDIGAVLLVGGSSRIPLVAQMVGAELGRPIAIDAHPKDAIAFGAAIAVAGRRGSATPETVTTLLPKDNRPPPPTVTPEGGWVRARGSDPRPAPPPGYGQPAGTGPNGGTGPARPPAPVPGPGAPVPAAESAAPGPGASVPAAGGPVPGPGASVPAAGGPVPAPGGAVPAPGGPAPGGPAPGSSAPGGAVPGGPVPGSGAPAPAAGGAVSGGPVPAASPAGAAPRPAPPAGAAGAADPRPAPPAGVDPRPSPPGPGAAGPQAGPAAPAATPRPGAGDPLSTAGAAAAGPVARSGSAPGTGDPARPGTGDPTSRPGAGDPAPRPGTGDPTARPGGGVPPTRTGGPGAADAGAAPRVGERRTWSAPGAADPQARPGGPVAQPSGYGATPSGERPAYGAPAPTPFGGIPRAGASPLGGISSGGHPPLAPYAAGSGPGGGGTGNRNLWIALGALIAVVLVAVVAFTQLGGDDETGGGGTGSQTTTTAAAADYTPQIEANFLASCTAGGQVSEAVCQCSFDRIEAEIPFERFMEIDAELTENPDAQPQELVDIVTECSEQEAPA